jgi:hypothetical protein
MHQPGTRRAKRSTSFPRSWLAFEAAFVGVRYGKRDVDRTVEAAGAAPRTRGAALRAPDAAVRRRASANRRPEETNRIRGSTNRSAEDAQG